MLLMVVLLSCPSGAPSKAASRSERSAAPRPTASKPAPKTLSSSRPRPSQAAAAARDDRTPKWLECEARERRWKSIVLHHSATERGDVASIDRIHRARTDANGRHWLGIGYHFVVGNGHGMDDGEIEPTFRWRQQLAGAHAGRKRANEEGIGVCVIGNCERQPPTARQIDSAERLIAALVTRYELDSESVIGHDAVLPTSCPGRYFPLERLKQSASRAIEVQDVPGGASAVPANMPTNALTHRTAKRVR